MKCDARPYQQTQDLSMLPANGSNPRPSSQKNAAATSKTAQERAKHAFYTPASKYPVRTGAISGQDCLANSNQIIPDPSTTSQ
jgi:hypothetical protein